jgi:sec-independent protein translocase protein TatA
MLGPLGAPELIIIAVVVVLLFGVGKLSGLGRDLGASVKEFRKAIKDEDSDKNKKAEAEAPQTQYTQQQPPQIQPPSQQSAPPPSSQPQSQYVPPQQPNQPHNPSSGESQGKQIF